MYYAFWSCGNFMSNFFLISAVGNRASWYLHARNLGRYVGCISTCGVGFTVGERRLCYLCVCAGFMLNLCCALLELFLPISQSWEKLQKVDTAYSASPTCRLKYSFERCLAGGQIGKQKNNAIAYFTHNQTHTEFRQLDRSGLVVKFYYAESCVDWKNTDHQMIFAQKTFPHYPVTRLQNCPRIRGFPWFPCAFPRKKNLLPRIKNSENFFFWVRMRECRHELFPALV
jgi:hypothetical protein